MSLNNKIKKIKKKLHSSRGFSISELLVAVVLMMLASSMCAECIKLANNQFNKSMRESRGQMLCTSLCTRLQDELTMARNARVEEGVLVYEGPYGTTKLVTTQFTGDGVNNYEVLSGEGYGEICLVHSGGSVEINEYDPISNHGMYEGDEDKKDSVAAGVRVDSVTEDNITITVSVYDGKDTSAKEITSTQLAVEPVLTGETEED